MKIIFTVFAQLLTFLILFSCGKKNSGSSSTPLSAPRYRALLLDQDQIVKGSVIIQEKESALETEVHVVNSALRKKLQRSTIIEGTCPASLETLEHAIRFDLGGERKSTLKMGTLPPPLGGHSVAIASHEALLACGALVPIPLE
jgi:hypothetical protein